MGASRAACSSRLKEAETFTCRNLEGIRDEAARHRTNVSLRETVDQELINLMRQRVATTSVGASTARGMGPKGTVAAARTYLTSLDLRRFAVESEAEFKAVLNRATRVYVRKMPRGAQYWGACRKFLNIFLRGVVYQKYLVEHYDLHHIEPWLEVPLDSHVAKRLRRELGGRKAAPPWRTVIGLEARTNAKYQKFASEVADQRGIDRVHLDVIYWRRVNDD